MNNRHRAINKITKRTKLLRAGKLGYYCNCATDYEKSKYSLSSYGTCMNCALKNMLSLSDAMREAYDE